jgi:transposase
MQGTPAEEVAVAQCPASFQIMFLGVMSSELSVPRPAFSWSKETLIHQKNSAQKVEEINRYWERRMEEKRQLATIPGTEEYEYLEKLNQDIRDGKSKWKKTRNANQVFKAEVFERGCLKENNTSKGGIDWFLYREKILLPLLFPYIIQVQEANPEKKVWFVDDNVGLHGKAHRSVADIAKRLGIQRVPFWPPNSPDLHPIENAFDYLKDRVDSYIPSNTSQNEKQRAGAFLFTEWRDRMDGIVRHLCFSFKDKLNLCKIHGGRNNFRS